MANRIKYLHVSPIILLLLVLGSNKSFGQLSGNNLAEFQFGNIPGVEPSNLSSLYDQLNLSYRQNNILLKGK